jgi:hypothetical protein
MLPEKQLKKLQEQVFRSTKLWLTAITTDMQTISPPSMLSEFNLITV